MSLERKFKLVYKQLRLYEDENGILRARRHLEKSSSPTDRRLPIVLPDKGHFVELLMSDVHLRVMHSTVNDKMAFLRERFWVL